MNWFIKVLCLVYGHSYRVNYRSNTCVCERCGKEIPLYKDRDGSGGGGFA